MSYIIEVREVTEKERKKHVADIAESERRRKLDADLSHQLAMEGLSPLEIAKEKMAQYFGGRKPPRRNLPNPNCRLKVVSIRDR